MTRDEEDHFLELCLSVLKGKELSSLNQDEVNILHLASLLLIGAYPKHSAVLEKVSNAFFETTQYQKLSALDMIQGKLAISLPRFKSMLINRIIFRIK